MNDEKYVFIQDSKEKAITARSARKRRTHAGKGGAVKFPSDYLSRKELNAMNGDVKSYKLNDPMTWEEFKALPDDVKVVYIKALRQKFGVSDSKIAQMMGAVQCTFSAEVRRLGIGGGRHQKMAVFDKVGWAAWCNKVSAHAVEETGESPTDFDCPVAIESVEPAPVEPAPQPVVPCSGKLEFECPADQALNMAAQILGNRMVNILISWDTAEVQNNG